MNKLQVLKLFIKIRFGALRNKSIENTPFKIQNFLGFQLTFNSYDCLLFSFKEIFIQEIYKFNPGNSQPIIIDAGSNIGLSVLYFKISHPTLQIIAFEPEKEIFNLLQLNISNNHLTNITIHPYALGNVIGKSNFDNTKSNLRGRLSTNSLHSEIVNTVKLSSFLNDETYFLKMDIEGAEMQVISDLMAENKLSLIQNFIIELHLYHSENSDLELKNFIELFENNNYSSKILLYGELNQKELLQDILIQFVKK